jgi:hypothetical protein
VLAQVFQDVCAAGALPMAPRLACVCTVWASTVHDTPELWRVLDTAALPASSSRPVAAKPSAAAGGPLRKRATAGGGGGAAAAAASGSAADHVPSRAEAGLRAWLASGRLQLLQELVLCCPGSTASQRTYLQDAGSEAAEASAAGGSGSGGRKGAGRDSSSSSSSSSNEGIELSGQLLMHVAQACPALRSVSISGNPGLKAAVSGPLVANTRCCQ